jgi:hypothetical protein
MVMLEMKPVSIGRIALVLVNFLLWAGPTLAAPTPQAISTLTKADLEDAWGVSFQHPVLVRGGLEVKFTVTDAQKAKPLINGIVQPVLTLHATGEKFKIVKTAWGDSELRPGATYAFVFSAATSRFTKGQGVSLVIANSQATLVIK